MKKYLIVVSGIANVTNYLRKIFTIKDFIGNQVHFLPCFNLMKMDCIVKKQLLIRMFSYITIKSMNKKRCFK